ncbi:hypothetical protein T484DRAFT_1878519, partial [Baffinella frigidus]
MAVNAASMAPSRALLVLQALWLLALLASASSPRDAPRDDGGAAGPPRSTTPGGSLEREACLRRLDERRVGSGGLEQEATLDAAVDSDRPWWGRWSGDAQYAPFSSGLYQCQPLSTALLSQIVRSGNHEKTHFNRCAFTLNAGKFEQSANAVPLILVVDPCSAKAAVRTDGALRTVEGVASTFLLIFLDRWFWVGALRTVEGVASTFLLIFLDTTPPVPPPGCADGRALEDGDMQKLLDIDFLEVRFLAMVASDRMLYSPPILATKFQTSLWSPLWGGWKGYQTVRAL